MALAIGSSVATTQTKKLKSGMIGSFSLAGFIILITMAVIAIPYFASGRLWFFWKCCVHPPVVEGREEGKIYVGDRLYGADLRRESLVTAIRSENGRIYVTVLKNGLFPFSFDYSLSHFKASHHQMKDIKQLRGV